MQNTSHHKKENNLSKIFSFNNIIIILILALISFFVWNKAETVKKESAPVIVNISADDHRVGNPNAKVTVIEYADMQCPACRAYEAITGPVIAEYSDRVNFIFRHFPLATIHQNAMLGAIATEAASKQGKFWEMKKVLYEKQAEWSTALDSKQKVMSYASTLGLDVKKFEADLIDPALEELVLNSLKEATRLGLNSTPSFIINGVRVDGGELSSIDKFKAYLDKELAK
jgi:protein-disulfide isomerase